MKSSQSKLFNFKMFQLIILLLPIMVTCDVFSVDKTTNRIVDSVGRQRIFHGSNVVYKTTPFIPITTKFDARYSFSAEDADLMASMGYNTIRLGVLWAGLEPTRGEYNMTYMAQVEDCENSWGTGHPLSLGHAPRCLQQEVLWQRGSGL